jgi:hypothetical protein
VVTAPVIVSLLALVLSVASLSWQAWSWYHSGPVLRVKTADFWTDAGNPESQVPDHYVAITITNHGRAAATAQAWGIEDPSGESLTVPSPWPFSDALPARVEPHASASFYVRGATLEDHSEELGVPYKKLRPWVQLATGKKVYARKGLPPL